MKRAIVVLALLLLTASVTAQDPPGFAMWKAAELARRDQALSTHIGPDRSARETLAEYGDHRFRYIRRDAGPGNPEQHDTIVDVVYVQSGQCTLVLGGTMVGKKASSGPGEYLGTGIDGGERHPLAEGDVVHIPAGVPHAFIVPAGQHVTYVLLKFPGK